METLIRNWRLRDGFGGQLPIVIPDYDIVMVFTAWNVLAGRVYGTARRLIGLWRRWRMRSGEVLNEGVGVL